MTIELITRQRTQTQGSIELLLEGDGQWVRVNGDSKLVSSAATRYYWGKKLGLKVEIGQGDESKGYFARLVVR
jgi:hypothetical protein